MITEEEIKNDDKWELDTEKCEECCGFFYKKKKLLNRFIYEKICPKCLIWKCAKEPNKFK